MRTPPQANTATTVWMRQVAQQVPWNVHPDSITLFLNCQNPLVAPRGRLAPTRFEAMGATLQLDHAHHRLLLVPKDTVVVLRAYRGTKQLFSHRFKASLPPLPTIKCFAPACGVGCKPFYSEYMRSVTLRAIPDPDFAAILPEDARYRVAHFRATLLRQGIAVELAPGQLAEKMVQGPQADMSDLTKISQFGDQLQIDVLLVQRQNALGVITDMPVTKRFLVGGLKCLPEQE